MAFRNFLNGGGWSGGSSSGMGIVGGEMMGEDPEGRWAAEARKQRMRAQISEEAHMLDAQQILSYLKNAGANPKRNVNAADQVLEYCSMLRNERANIEAEARSKARQLGEARAENKYLSSDARAAQSELEGMRRKYLDNKDKLDRADRRKDEAVAKVAAQMHEAELAHERSKRESEAHLVRKIGMLEAELRQMQLEHETALAALAEQHAGALADRDTQHQQAQKTLHDDKEREIDEIIDFHEAETQVLKDKVRELAADLISQTDDFRPATDEALRIKLLDLRKRIKNLTVPNNLHLLPPDGHDHLPPDLDPSGFVKRHGARELQYLLRGLVWDVLIESFFGEPFGFGFLGRGEGHARLLEIHQIWLAFYTGSHSRHYSSQTSSTADLSVYQHDYNANKLRSAIFQSFLPAVFPEKAMRQQMVALQQQEQKKADSPQAQAKASGYSPQQLQQSLTLQQRVQTAAGLPPLPPKPMAYGSGGRLSQTLPHTLSSSTVGVGELHRQHCQGVIVALTALLNRITGGATRPDALEAVPTIVNQAAELGLECGVQRVQLQLLTAQPGDTVKIGSEYQDCLGSDKGQGQELAVDLLVSPGLVRIGDGWGETATRKPLVPCEFFPHLL